MKISCLQMDMKLGCPQENFKKAEVLIERAVNDGADILVFPETWNTGFFPKENLEQLCCNDGKEVKEVIASLAYKYKVNIVAGSVSNLKDGKVYNFNYMEKGEKKTVDLNLLYTLLESGKPIVLTQQE